MNAFFIRCHTVGEAGTADVDPLTAGSTPVAAQHDVRFRLVSAQRRTRVLILVSRVPPRLTDLLRRTRSGELPIEIVGVVSDHPDHHSLVAWHAIPFHHVPGTVGTKPEEEQRLLELVGHYDVEPVVLARGVKVRGATAHCVTTDLDEGPIVAQRVVPVDHARTPDDLAAVGREAEIQALSSAVKRHAEVRVVLSGNRTIVLVPDRAGTCSACRATVRQRDGRLERSHPDGPAGLQ